MRTGVSAMEGRTLQYKDVGTSEENWDFFLDKNPDFQRKNQRQLRLGQPYWGYSHPSIGLWGPSRKTGLKAAILFSKRDDHEKENTRLAGRFQNIAHENAPPNFNVEIFCIQS